MHRFIRRSVRHDWRLLLRPHVAMLVVLVGGVGVIERPHRVPDTTALNEEHDRVLNRMSAGPRDHDPHMGRDTATASPILSHGPDDPWPLGRDSPGACGSNAFDQPSSHSPNRSTISTSRSFGAESWRRVHEACGVSTTSSTFARARNRLVTHGLILASVGEPAQKVYPLARGQHSGLAAVSDAVATQRAAGSCSGTTQHPQRDNVSVLCPRGAGTADLRGLPEPIFGSRMRYGRYWARTSDLRLVEAALSQLS